MKIKISHFIFTGLAGISIAHYYTNVQSLSINSIPAEETHNKQESSDTLVTSDANSHSSFHFSDFNNQIYPQPNLYTDLTNQLTALNPNSTVRLNHINQLAQCADCLELLTSALTHSLSAKQAIQLANSLSRTQKPEFANLLAKTIETLFHEKQTERAEQLLSGLMNFKTTAIGKQFIHYLSNTDLPFALQNTLSSTIDNISNREQIANEIVSTFNQSNDETKQRLLAIDNPESLAQLNRQALLENNTALYEKTLEQLKSNPSPYALDTLLTLKNDAVSNTSELETWKNATYDLAQRQFSGNRLDYIENKLAQNGYSEQDKTIVLDILSHSEDMIRASEIINKFSTQ